MEEVIAVLVALTALMAGGTSQPDPFDQYLAGVNSHRAEPERNEFAKDCPDVLTGSQSSLAVRTGSHWSLTNDIYKAYKANDSDFFDSAEVWGEPGKSRLIEFWSLTTDVQSEIRSIFCLDDKGRVSKVRVTNWSFEIAGNQQIWRHELFESFNVDGKMVAKQSYFVDASGRRTSKPRGAYGIEGFDSVPSEGQISRLLSELSKSAIHNQDTR